MPQFLLPRAVCALVLVCITLGAAPLEPTRLLVLPLSPAPAATARSEPRQHVTTREAIEQALFDDLPDERLEVVSPERSDGGQPVAAPTPAAVAQLGHDAGAAYVLVGRYRVRGEALRVDARLVQTASGRTAAVFAVEGTTDDLPAVQRQLVSDVRWHVDVAESGPLPELAPELRPPVEVAGDAGIPLPRGPGAYGLDGAAPLPPGAHTGTSGGAPWRRASDDGDDFYDPDRFRPAVTPGGGNTMLAGAGNQVGSPSAGPGARATATTSSPATATRSPAATGTRSSAGIAGRSRPSTPT
jgi:TolB-like protein